MKTRISLNTLLVMSIFLLVMTYTASGQIIYVDDGANGAKNGRNWIDAYSYLQDALAAATKGDQIWVAEGAYHPSEPTNPYDIRTSTFQLINEVALYGGFPSGGDPNFNERDVELYETILSGDFNSDDIVIEPGQGSPGENCNEAGVILDGETVFDTTGSTTDGPGDCSTNQDIWYIYTASETGTLTISLCDSYYDTHLSVYEGAACPPTTLLACNDDFCGEKSQVSIAVTQRTDYLIRVGAYRGSYGTGVINIFFGSNSDGTDNNSYHVIMASGTDETAILDGFTITAGNANGSFSNNSGGGMYNYESSPTITNCTFSNNSAYSGGGMYNDEECNQIVINCTFSNNSAHLGGGMSNRGGSPTVTNCTFAGNSSGYHAGGMLNYDGSSTTVTNCTFSGNSTDYGSGGGMYNMDGSNSVTNCIFSGNSADRSHGGGMYNSRSSSTTVTNCTFSGNLASYWGGGMVNSHSSSTTVTNCTFSGNSAGYYGGGMVNDYNSSTTMINCILWGNTASIGDEIYNHNGLVFPMISYCDIFNSGGSGVGWDTSLGTDGGGNIDADPFLTPDGHLRAGSPCIDAGDPNFVADLDATDLDGNPRIVNDIVDMGAYEVQLDDPIELLDMLAGYIIDLDLHPGIENSLLAKIDTAIDKLEDDNDKNDKAAINSLRAFINEVEAQSGKKIPENDADALIAGVLEIIDLLSTK